MDHGFYPKTKGTEKKCKYISNCTACLKVEVERSVIKALFYGIIIIILPWVYMINVFIKKKAKKKICLVIKT